jgi:Crp-like helix-turn-helix domain
MTLIDTAWRAVMDAGVQVLPVDARHVELRRGRRSARVRLHVSSRVLNPSDIADLAGRYREPGLLVVPAASAAVLHAVEQAGWSWLTTGTRDVRGVLRLDGRAFPVGPTDDADRGRAARSRSGPVPWGSLTVVRRLLLEPPTTQQTLAASAGVSQPRVSQTLAALAEQQLVRRREDGWVVRDFDGLLRLWLEAYPGPGGISAYWYGLDSPREQALAVTRQLTGLTADSRRRRYQEELAAVVSGDLAADLLAPWRTPARAVIYARVGADLTSAGLTPTGGEEATLELVLPQDPGIWPLKDSWWSPSRVEAGVREARQRDEAPLPIADPVQVLWDVRRAPGPDSDEAAGRLWQLLRERSQLVHGPAES